MKIQFLVGIVSAMAIGSVAGKVMTQQSEGLPRWADSEVFEVNKGPAHVFSLVFPGEKPTRPEPNWDNPFAGSIQSTSRMKPLFTRPIKPAHLLK